jgi:hypothetical protein
VREIKTVLNILALMTLALSFFVSAASCAQVYRSGKNAEKDAKDNSLPTEIPNGQDKRIAIPDIEGCSRDQTTFYRGKVLRFRRTQKLIEITIHTEWDTTEKLVHFVRANPVEYRLQNKPISDSEFRQVESRLKDRAAAVRATVWVCQIEGSQRVKIIDWEAADSRTVR